LIELKTRGANPLNQALTFCLRAVHVFLFSEKCIIVMKTKIFLTSEILLADELFFYVNGVKEIVGKW
jgi:hypothetical protein